MRQAEKGVKQAGEPFVEKREGVEREAGQEDLVRRLRDELHINQAKMEQVKIEKGKLNGRLKTIEKHR